MVCSATLCDVVHRNQAQLVNVEYLRERDISFCAAFPALEHESKRVGSRRLGSMYHFMPTFRASTHSLANSIASSPIQLQFSLGRRFDTTISGFLCPGHYGTNMQPAYSEELVRDGLTVMLNLMTMCGTAASRTTSSSKFEIIRLSCCGVSKRRVVSGTPSGLGWPRVTELELRLALASPVKIGVRGRC